MEKLERNEIKKVHREQGMSARAGIPIAIGGEALNLMNLSPDIYQRICRRGWS